jgi:hypothetical protein
MDMRRGILQSTGAENPRFNEILESDPTYTSYNRFGGIWSQKDGAESAQGQSVDFPAGFGPRVPLPPPPPPMHHLPPPGMQGMGPPPPRNDTIAIEDDHDSKGISDLDLTEHQLLLLCPTTYGFALKTKQWRK